MEQGSSDTPASDPSAPFILEAFLPYELSVAATRTSRLFARNYAAAFGLSIAEWRVLAVVGRCDGIMATAVAERSEMDKVKVSRATARLIALGLLAQSPDPQDGRIRALSLSAQGARVHDAIVALGRTLERQIAAGLDADEWTALRACLRKLNAHVRALEAATPEAGTGHAETSASSG